MKNLFTMILALAALAFGAVGCGGDSCISRCEQGKEMGCVAESTDCEASCDDAEAAEETARMNAETAGCSAEFSAVQSCTDSAEVCDTSACSTEVSALTDCFVTFCTANPDSPACTAP